MASEDSFNYLVPGHGEKHRRARNWTDGEMKGLLYVWEEYHPELKMSKRNAKVYEKMAQRFFELTGEHRHKEEIKMKITNMSFQYRKLKCTASECGESPDWPYYKAIEKILSRPVENGRINSFEFQASAAGPSTSSHTTGTETQPEGHPVGFLPEYTGSSDELDMKQELLDDSVTSGSMLSLGSSPRPSSAKRKRVDTKQVSLKKKKLRVMVSMLKEQRKVSRAVEETCREVRRAMHQQNLLQVQCLQLQERMMNLLEKMIQTPATQPTTWALAGTKEPGKG